MSEIQRSIIYNVSVRGGREAARELMSLTDIYKRGQNAANEAEAAGVRSATTASNRKRSLVEGEQDFVRKAQERTSAFLMSEWKKRQASAAKVAKDAERDAKKSGDAIVKEMNREQREFEKKEKEKTRIAQREAKLRERTESQIQKSVLKAQENTSREMMRQRSQVQHEMSRKAYQYERDRRFEDRRLYKGISTGITEGLGAGVSTMKSMAGRGISALAGGTGIKRAVDVEDIIAERMEVQRMLRSVGIEGRAAGGVGTFDEKAAYDTIRRTAASTGLTQRDLMGAIDVYSEKGLAGSAIGNIDRTAKQAMALGVDAAVIAKLRSQLHISSASQGKELSDDKIDQMIAKMHFAGKTGVFRAGAIAEESEELFSRFAGSGMDFEKGFDRYLGFANQARIARGSGATARTSINAVQDAIVKKEDKLHALGVKTRDKDGNERDFIDIAMDAIEKTGGQGKAFTTIFDPSKSGKALSTMVSAYHAAKGGKAGRAAMEQLLTGDPSMKDASVAEMYKDADTRIGGQGNQLAMQSERARQKISEALVPALEKLSQYMPKLVDAFVKFLDWAMKHPYLAGAAVLGAGAAQSFGGMALQGGMNAIGRYGAGMLVNTVPGFTPGGAAAGAMGAGGVGGAGLGPGAAGAGLGLGAVIPVVAAGLAGLGLGTLIAPEVGKMKLGFGENADASIDDWIDNLANPDAQGFKTARFGGPAVDMLGDSIDAIAKAALAGEQASPAEQRRRMGDRASGQAIDDVTAALGDTFEDGLNNPGGEFSTYKAKLGLGKGMDLDGIVANAIREGQGPSALDSVGRGVSGVGGVLAGAFGVAGQIGTQAATPKPVEEAGQQVKVFSAELTKSIDALREFTRETRKAQRTNDSPIK